MMAVQLGLPGIDAVSYTISATDVSAPAVESAIGGTRKISTAVDTMEGRMRTQVATIQKHWLGISAAVFAAYEAISKGWEMAEKAAQFKEMQAGLNALASQYGMTGDAATKMAQSAVGGQLSMRAAGELAAKAFTLGLDPKKVETFLAQTERLTDVVGGDIPKAFEAMEMAAATGRSKGLVQYGIIVDLNRAMKEYADKHGIVEASISAHTAMQIRSNAIMEAAQKRINLMGEATDSTADKMNQLRASGQDLQLVFGQGLIRAAAGAYGSLQMLASSALSIYSVYLKTKAVALWFDSKTGGSTARTAEQAAQQGQQAADEARAAEAAAADLFGKGATNFELMTAAASDFAKAMAPVRVALADTSGEVTKPNNKALDDHIRAWADIADMEISLIAMRDQFDRESAQKLYADKAKLDMEEIDRTVAMARDEYAREEKAAQDTERIWLDTYQVMIAGDQAREQAHAESLERQVALSKNAADAEKDLKNDVIGNTITLLQMLGDKSKAFAVMAIALNTGVEIARSIQTTAVASMLAFSSQVIPGIPYTYAAGAAAAAAVNAWGAVNIGLIAAAGALRIGSALSGGGSSVPGTFSGGSGMETVYQNRQEEKSRGGPSIQIHIYGNVVDHDKFARELIPSITKAWEDRVS